MIEIFGLFEFIFGFNQRREGCDKRDNGLIILDLLFGIKLLQNLYDRIENG